MSGAEGRPVDVFWSVPTAGDGAGPGRRHRGGWDASAAPAVVAPVRDDRADRFTHADYLNQIARGAQATGYRGIALPDDPAGEDPWVLGAALAREAPRLHVLTEFSPSIGNPVYAAKMAATFQRFSGGRQRWQLRLDDGVPAGQRHAQVAEFLTIARGVWQGSPFDHEGRWFTVRGGGFDPKLTVDGFPAVHLSGESDDDLELAAAQADVHVIDVAGLAHLQATFGRLDARAAEQERRVRHGVRLSILARDDEEEAWGDLADRWSAHAAAAGTPLGPVDDHRVTDVVFRGFDRIGHAAPAGLVGSYERVADALQLLIDSGVDTFIIGASPSLEEVYHLGERLLPRLSGHIHHTRPARPVAV
jgi:alkanesulfonate monooxygenase